MHDASRRRLGLRRSQLSRTPADHRHGGSAGRRGRGARRSRAVDHARRTCSRRSQRKGSALRDVRQILLTHIHLDHAGATGSLLQAEPGDRGVRARARRAAPDRSVEAHGERRRGSYGAGHGSAVGRRAAGARGAGQSAATATSASRPAAASSRSRTRRVTRRITSATSIASSGVAFVGDTAGIRRGSGTYIMPPTPPPDIDLEAWRQSARSHPGVGSGHAVPHAFRSVPRRAAALPAALRSAGRLERARPVGSWPTRRSTTRSASRRFVEEALDRHPADGRRVRSRALQSRRPARLFVAGPRCGTGAEEIPELQPDSGTPLGTPLIDRGGGHVCHPQRRSSRRGRCYCVSSTAFAQVDSEADAALRRSPPRTRPGIRPRNRSSSPATPTIPPVRRSFFNGNEMVRSGFYRGVPIYTRTTEEPYSKVFVPLVRRTDAAVRAPS